MLVRPLFSNSLEFSSETPLVIQEVELDDETIRQQMWRDRRLEEIKGYPNTTCGALSAMIYFSGISIILLSPDPDFCEVENCLGKRIGIGIMTAGFMSMFVSAVRENLKFLSQ